MQTALYLNLTGLIVSLTIKVVLLVTDTVKEHANLNVEHKCLYNHLLVINYE